LRGCRFRPGVLGGAVTRRMVNVDRFRALHPPVVGDDDASLSDVGDATGRGIDVAVTMRVDPGGGVVRTGSVVAMGGRQRQRGGGTVDGVSEREGPDPSKSHSTLTIVPAPGGTSARTSSVTASPGATTARAVPLTAT